MIITAIINVAYFVLNLIVGIFPTSSGFPAEVETAFQVLGSYLAAVNDFLPLDTILSALLLLFSVEIAIFGFKTIKWLISHIPWVGGKGN